MEIFLKREAKKIEKEIAKRQSEDTALLEDSEEENWVKSSWEEMQAVLRDVKNLGVNEAIKKHPVAATMSGGVLMVAGLPLAILGPFGLVFAVPMFLSGSYMAIKGALHIKD